MKNAIKLRTIFMGTSAFAETILNSLIQAEYNVVSVYTQPDKKAGSDKQVQKTPVKITAEKNNIPVFEPDKLDENVIQKIREQKPDLIVVAAYGKILPNAILEIPGFGAINVHASLLPKYRGPSPIQNALLSGETETGTTIMLMGEGIDTGDILSQRKTQINKDETAFELSKKLSQLSSDLLLETIPLWVERKIKPQKQDDSQASLCQLIERADGKIFWAEEAESIYNKFRAFYPWPGIFTFWQRTNENYPKRIKLNKISFSKTNPPTSHHIGEVFQIAEKVAVQTVSGIIVLEEIQMEGKPNMKIEEFLNGYPDFIGSILR